MAFLSEFHLFYQIEPAHGNAVGCSAKQLGLVRLAGEHWGSARLLKHPPKYIIGNFIYFPTPITLIITGGPFCLFWTWRDCYWVFETLDATLRWWAQSHNYEHVSKSTSVTHLRACNQRHSHSNCSCCPAAAYSCQVSWLNKWSSACRSAQTAGILG